MVVHQSEPRPRRPPGPQVVSDCSASAARPRQRRARRRCPDGLNSAWPCWRERPPRTWRGHFCCISVASTIGLRHNQRPQLPHDRAPAQRLVHIRSGVKRTPRVALHREPLPPPLEQKDLGCSTPDARSGRARATASARNSIRSPRTGTGRGTTGGARHVEALHAVRVGSKSAHDESLHPRPHAAHVDAARRASAPCASAS